MNVQTYQRQVLGLCLYSAALALVMIWQAIA